MSLSSLWNFKQTTDDRGQSIECRSLRAIQRQASRDPALVATVDRITAEMFIHYSVWKIVLISMLSMALLVASRYWFGSQPFFLEFAPALIILTITGLEWTRKYYRKMMPAVTRILIEEGICAGCAYPLEGLSEDTDGMLVCPECSATWLRSRVLRFAPIAKHVTACTMRGELSHLVTQVRRGTDRRGIRDDRDSPRAVIALRTTRKVRSDATDNHRDRLNVAANALRPIGRVRRLMSASSNVVLAAVMIAPISLIAPIRSGVPLVLFAFVAFFALIQLVSAIDILFSDLGRPSKLVRTEFLRQDLCPCCAADLQGLPQDHDQHTVCLDCGATWKLGDPD